MNPQPALTVYAQACDLCRRMKIKCEREDDLCTHCIASNVECTFAPVERKPPKIKRPEVLESMEQRIQRMEAILSATVLDKRQADSLDDADETELTDDSSSLAVNVCGGERFIGPASALSLLSPGGCQWIGQRLSSVQPIKLKLEAFTSRDQHTPDIGSEYLQPLSDDQREPLPRKRIAIEYIDAFFQGINDTYPIFNRPMFAAKLHQIYTTKQVDDVDWYACLNVVMAIGNLLQLKDRAVSTASKAQPDRASPLQSWKLFRNASSHLMDLMMRPSLAAVQALVTMLYMIQIVPNDGIFSIILSAAVQASHRLGLHTSISTTTTSLDEAEQRRTVFWLVFIFEQSEGLRTGAPTSLQIDDVGVRLPCQPISSSTFSRISSPVSQASSTAESTSEPSVFRLRAELTLLQNSLHRKLYSPRSRLRSQLERLSSISQIDNALQSWQQKLPALIQPSNLSSAPSSLKRHIVHLHLAYLDTLCCLHRASTFNTSWFTSPRDAPLLTASATSTRTRAYASTSISATSARSIIALLSHARPVILAANQFAHYAISASLTLFAHIVSNPEDIHTDTETQALTDAAAFLLPILPSASSEIEKMQELAVTAIAKAKTAALTKVKRARDTNAELVRLASKDPAMQASGHLPPALMGSESNVTGFAAGPIPAQLSDLYAASTTVEPSFDVGAQASYMHMPSPTNFLPTNHSTFPAERHALQQEPPRLDQPDFPTHPISSVSYQQQQQQSLPDLGLCLNMETTTRRMSDVDATARHCPRNEWSDGYTQGPWVADDQVLGAEEVGGGPGIDGPTGWGWWYGIGEQEGQGGEGERRG